MVSLFTLGVSFISGVFYACRWLWNMLVGAILSVSASILDGCDGRSLVEASGIRFRLLLETDLRLPLLFVYLRGYGDQAFSGVQASGPIWYGVAAVLGAIASFSPLGSSDTSSRADVPNDTWNLADAGRQSTIEPFVIPRPEF